MTCSDYASSIPLATIQLHFFDVKGKMAGMEPAMKILFICGKGGVGRTAMTAALARYFGNRGGSLAVTLNDPDNLGHHLNTLIPFNTPSPAHDGIHVMALEKQRILDDYIARHFAVGFMRRWILNHPLYPHITAILPGIREVLLIDKIVECTTSCHSNQWQTILVDMPATGHSISLLNISETAAATIEYGPLRRRLIRIRSRLTDPTFCRAVVVTSAEETPVRECRELILALQNRVSIAIDCLVVNRIDPTPLSEESITILNRMSLESIEILASDMCPDTTCNTTHITADSMLTAIRTQLARSTLAKHMIHSLSDWWQEPLVLIPRMDGETPAIITQNIADALETGGFHG
ncbi:hypothetical protein JXA80_00965 [bacterium]|nr:hypothetical protein [candidate division CSSED10-310 bacterium]